MRQTRQTMTKSSRTPYHRLTCTEPTRKRPTCKESTRKRPTRREQSKNDDIYYNPGQNITIMSDLLQLWTIEQSRKHSVVIRTIQEVSSGDQPPILSKLNHFSISIRLETTLKQRQRLPSRKYFCQIININTLQTYLHHILTIIYYENGIFYALRF